MENASETEVLSSPSCRLDSLGSPRFVGDTYVEHRAVLHRFHPNLDRIPRTEEPNPLHPRYKTTLSPSGVPGISNEAARCAGNRSESRVLYTMH